MNTFACYLSFGSCKTTNLFDIHRKSIVEEEFDREIIARDVVLLKLAIV